jgi:hypothetical protein
MDFKEEFDYILSLFSPPGSFENVLEQKAKLDPILKIK